MAIDDVRAMSAEDLATELYETRRELMNLRFRAATMQLANVNEIGKAKKRVAQILTVMRERELGIAT
ncbi:MAG: 50S ribosomal protein L29 [Dehalococcoidia bacterium]|nr:50S ribosomal protein L29 [Dehalococcoidia bacterium]